MRRELEAIKEGYAAQSRVLLKRLPGIGFDDFFPVDGAFYVYVDVGRYTNDFMRLLQAAFSTRPASRPRPAPTSTLGVEVFIPLPLTFCRNCKTIRPREPRLRCWSRSWDAILQESGGALAD